MASKTRQPVYVYDEPVTYMDFDGGINNDPTNNNLRDNELRDAVNCSYNNRTLERRLGAKLYKDLKFADPQPGETRGFVQGQFTLTAGNTYYIVAKDGELYYSQLDVTNELFVLAALPVNLSEDYFNGAIGPLDSRYIIAGLDIYTEYPNRHLDNEGYILNYTAPVEIGNDFTELDDVATVGILVPISKRFVFQNYKLVDGAVLNDELVIATGSRLVKVKEEAGQLVAELLTPKEINSWEYGNVGFNYLSPFPTLHVFDTYLLGTSRITNVICKTHHIFKDDTNVTFESILDYKKGTDKDSYYFQWEYKLPSGDWTIDVAFTLGEDTYTLATAALVEGDEVLIRCTYSNTNPVDEITSTFGATFTSFTVMAGASSAYVPTPVQEFLEIQTCNRMLVDGKKLILYGNPYKSAQWYKSIIGDFDYYSAQGQLDFQTNKNERIIGVTPLDGNLIVFADSEHLGGSMHLVTGNGDDYEGDQYYSPYKKKVIHPTISCDHPNSIQYVQNFVLFKYRDIIWMLHSKELSSERVTLMSVNDLINHESLDLRVPSIPYSVGYENKLFSTIDDQCYTLVYPEYGVQWKMYYKLPKYYDNNNKQVYPWLRDSSPVLNTKGILKINGINTYMTESNKLVQFTDSKRRDLEEEFKTKWILKALNLGMEGNVKFLNNTLLSYHRSAEDTLKLNVFGYNEANYKVLGPNLSAFIDEDSQEVVYGNAGNYYDRDSNYMDKPSVYMGEDNKVPLSKTKLDVPIASSRSYITSRRFPFLNLSLVIEFYSEEAMSLSSVTFEYMSTTIAPRSLPMLYPKIIREE